MWTTILKVEHFKRRMTYTQVIDMNLPTSGLKVISDMSNLSWPSNWDDLTSGIGCEMCNSSRPDNDRHGIRIFRSEHVDAILQRANVQRGYTLVIWRGRHVNEPFELSESEALEYWHAVMTVGAALTDYYQPLKMNYETLGNSLPHLHTHMLPRYVEDPAPGRPFPLLPLDGSEPAISGEELEQDGKALSTALGHSRH
ncbi:HIT family protein [Nocardia terpenica]|uniref:HIT family protein n=2 Tax=Nocardia terpenica TaxID=455432 RepID=UPI0009EE9456